MITPVLLFLSIGLVLSQSCYWNNHCSYQLFSSKTPYGAVRGDIRDYEISQNCNAVSIWSLNRHGNRNPGASETIAAKAISELKDGIFESNLCAQDTENIHNWKWNDTLDVSHSYLTGTGYEELFDIAKRLREKYPHLLEGTENDYYFRTTNEQRTVTSSLAFVHGLTKGTNLTLAVDGPWVRDDVIRPYENCEKYQKEVKDGPSQTAEMNAYYNSKEFAEVTANVQERLNLVTRLSSSEVYSLYELCRFYRSWEPTLTSPWCALFSIKDLVVLEYSDDVRHYHRNGYGSSVNVQLGGLAVKDLYETLEASVHGRGKRVTAYFTHDTMIEMTLSAMGLFKDNFVLLGAKRNPSRKWRTSEFASFSSNILAVLNSCEEHGQQVHRVQLFVNEKPTELCPLDGCGWQQFSDLFRSFLTADLSFCELGKGGDAARTSTAGLNSMAFIAGLILAIVWVLRRCNL